MESENEKSVNFWRFEWETIEVVVQTVICKINKRVNVKLMLEFKGANRYPCELLPKILALLYQWFKQKLNS